jgi:hypothetical protein
MLPYLSFFSALQGWGQAYGQRRIKGALNRLLYSPLKANVNLQGNMLIAFFIPILQSPVMFLFA